MDVVLVLTGIQNIGVAMAIFIFTFDKPESDIGAVICTVRNIFQ